MLEVIVQKRFDGFVLDIAFTAASSLIVLFGPSGSGKSLTLQAIAGVVSLDAGRIRIDDQLLYDSAQQIYIPSQARRVGYVPQQYALFPHLSVAHNISFGLTRLSHRERTRRVAEMIETFNLGGLEQRRPHELSGGQRQRVALARAVAMQPRLLLLDEPFSALDAPLRATLRQELLQLQQRLNITIVLVSHDLADAFMLGQHLIVYENGHIIQQGAREDVFFRPATQRVAELVGTRNILPAIVAQVEPETVWVQWQGHHIAVASTPIAPGSSVYLCVRPTQILIVRPERLTERERENLLQGRIVSVMTQAEMYTLQVQVDGSSAIYDLEIILPGYVYHRLALDREKHLFMEFRRYELHLIPRA